MILYPLRYKYRVRKSVKATPYKTRTGTRKGYRGSINWTKGSGAK